MGWVGCAVGLVGLVKIRARAKDQTKGTYIYNKVQRLGLIYRVFIYMLHKKGCVWWGQVRFVHRLDKGETSKELFYGVNFIRSKRVLNEQGNKRQIYICLYFNALNYKGVLLSFRGLALSH